MPTGVPFAILHSAENKKGTAVTQRRGLIYAAGLAVWAFAQPVSAADGVVSLSAPGADKSLSDQLKAASLTEETGATKAPNAQDLFASARSDYARLLGVLYDEGYYSGVISILVDGKEASSIEPLDAPDQIGHVAITVTPGPRFHFARAEVGPLAPEAQVSPDFAAGKIARTSTILGAGNGAVSAWKEAGHAKAAVAEQRITADHRSSTVDAEIGIDPGPAVRFGSLQLSGNKRLRTERLAAIAGFPTGRVFTPERVTEVQSRLRRTGIFSSVTLTEAEKVNPDGTLDYRLNVVEDKPRRMGAGAEYGSSDGLTLTGYWLHRDLWGGGEKLRVDAEVKGIGGSGSATKGPADYTLGVRLDRPATISPDTSSYYMAKAFKNTEEDYTEWGSKIGGGLTHIFNDRLTGETGIAYIWSRVNDDFGATYFRQIAFENKLIWDNRDNAADATRGYYGQLKVTPFYGLGASTDSGMQVSGDFRTYKSVSDSLVLAGRAQIGAVYGSGLANTPRSYLFYSGGGGTVRGQPYQSLGVTELHDGQLTTGGMRFIGLSGEARFAMTGSIGLVAFYDAGYVSSDEFLSNNGAWQSGAGLGLRYKTPIGPIRFDVAAPVSGSTGAGVQIYLGIGQAF